MTLEDLGWNAAFESEFAPYYAKGWKPARIIRDNRITFGALLVDGGGQELEVTMSGKVYHDAETDADLPAVGDWVALEVGGEGEESVIQARLARQSRFSRRAAGHSAEEQVMATNIHFVVVVTDAGQDLNPRRLERYFFLINRSGAKPIVLINKSDLCSDAQNEEAAQAIRALNPDAMVFMTSAIKKTGLKDFRKLFKPGITMAFIGSSGVGKSALINLLLGDDWQWTSEVNQVTGKGRHTTTARELLFLPKLGGMLIDNPGIREVQMWTDEKTLREGFADLEELAGQCKYYDCKHGTDAGCAIRQAIEAGRIEAGRLAGFLKLDAEIENLRTRRKKRQITIDRRAKRDHRTKLRNPSDRKELRAEMNLRA